METLGLNKHREDKRQDEIRALTSQGKIPHEVELEKHPEKSLDGRMCKTTMSKRKNQMSSSILGLMGQVAGSIKEIRSAQEM